MAITPTTTERGIQLGDLASEVTRAVQSALSQQPTATSAAVFRNPRIIIGLILEPAVLQEAKQQ